MKVISGKSSTFAPDINKRIGIVDSGNEYVMSDLYKMNFKTDMSEKEYLRDSNYSTEPGLESDVLAEQTKINSADAIVFIYPIFWTEAPA